MIGQRRIENENHGSFVQAGSQVTFFRPAFINTGLIDVQAGRLDLDSQTSFVQTAGTIRVWTGAEFESSGPTLNIQGGRLEGDGLVDADIDMAGVLAPGLSAGQLTIQGDLELLAGSQFEVEIEGLMQGTTYDFVDVIGNVVLGGDLSLSFLSGFGNTSLATQQLTVLTANTNLTGAFANVENGSRLSAAGGASFQVNYGPSSAFDPNSVVLSDHQPPEIPVPSLSALGVALLCGLLGFGGLRRLRA